MSSTEPEHSIEDLDGIFKRGYYHAPTDPEGNKRYATYAGVPRFKTNQPACMNLAWYIINYEGPVNGYGIPHLDPQSLKFLLCFMDRNFPIHYWTNNFDPKDRQVIQALYDEV